MKMNKQFNILALIVFCATFNAYADQTINTTAKMLAKITIENSDGINTITAVLVTPQQALQILKMENKNCTVSIDELADGIAFNIDNVLYVVQTEDSTNIITMTINLGVNVVDPSDDETISQL